MNHEKDGKDEKDAGVLVEKVRELETRKSAERDAAKLDKENTSLILNEKRVISPVISDKEAKEEMLRRSLRTFLIGGAAATAGVFGYFWLRKPEQTWIFERALRFNEAVSQTFYSPARLAAEFPRERAAEPRVNGGEGMSEGFDAAKWKLQVVGVANPRSFPQYVDNIAYQTATDNNHAGDDSSRQHETPESQDAKQNPNAPANPQNTMKESAAEVPEPGLLLTLDDIKKLPRIEMTTELKCIEGWSIVVNWAGARFADFIEKFLPNTRGGGQPNFANPQDFQRYVSLVTPDGGYYVGMDMPSILHPQTLLCYEMNGAPLSMQHGAPLRLVTPTKYGIKQLKRIGRIEFTDERPADYWAERGYDWYSGH